MERKNLTKHAYQAPWSTPTEVTFEQSLLVATARMLLEVNELEQMNDAPEDEQPGGEMYFEF